MLVEGLASAPLGEGVLCLSVCCCVQEATCVSEMWCCSPLVQITQRLQGNLSEVMKFGLPQAAQPQSLDCWHQD